MAIFIAALTPLFRTHLLRMQPMTIPAPSSFMGDDLEATQHGIGAIRNEPYDEHDLFRVSLLESMVSKMFGDDVQQGEFITNTSTHSARMLIATSEGTASQQQRAGHRQPSFHLPDTSPRPQLGLVGTPYRSPYGPGGLA